MTVLDSILRDLRELPPPKLAEVARFVHQLNPKSRERRLEALRATAGCLNDEEGEEFERAVMEEAERIDADSK